VALGGCGGFGGCGGSVVIVLTSKFKNKSWVGRHPYRSKKNSDLLILHLGKSVKLSGLLILKKIFPVLGVCSIA
jgi:hypothetical protein